VYTVRITIVKRTVIAALLLAALPIVARTRAVRSVPAPPPLRSVMWIGAHPDDESIIAPLLALYCREQRASCTMLILTRGERGPCLLAGGCHEDLASVRSDEAAAAAQYFNANLILLTLPDGGGVTPPPWANAESAIGTVAGEIAATNPDAIFTFDPRHGTTCHPDHRATASLVLDAVARLAHPPQVYFLETRLHIDASPFGMRFARATSSNAVLRFDASARWSAIIDDMKRHPSQFDDAWLNAVEQIPIAYRAVYIAPAPAILGETIAEGCD
jgi:LmbE family N-acetylglucosaminyl deacetylase